MTLTSRFPFDLSSFQDARNHVVLHRTNDRDDRAVASESSIRSGRLPLHSIDCSYRFRPQGNDRQDDDPSLDHMGSSSHSLPSSDHFDLSKLCDCCELAAFINDQPILQYLHKKLVASPILWQCRMAFDCRVPRFVSILPSFHIAQSSSSADSNDSEIGDTTKTSSSLPAMSSQHDSYRCGTP